MSPQTLHLVRHAQGFHNLSVQNHRMPDPTLTNYGLEQCRHLHSTFPHADGIDLVVASPLKRTLYTALHSFRGAIAKGKLRIVALPDLQETSDLPCDTGSDLAELRREFADQPVDLEEVAKRPDWTVKTGDFAPWADPLAARAKRAREWLRTRPERNIVVVTHGGFLHYLTEDFSDYDHFNGTGWANCEFRSYTFDPKRAPSASLTETPTSLKLRGVQPPPTEAESHGLKGSAARVLHRKHHHNDAAPAPGPAIQSKFSKARQERDWIGGY